MSLRLASTRLTSSLGTSARRLSAYQTSTRRNMSTTATTTKIFGREIEKRTLYSVLAVLGTVEGYFWYTYYNKESSSSSTSEQNGTIENKPLNN